MDKSVKKEKWLFYYLKSCDTCQRILKGMHPHNFHLINIKEFPLTKPQLEELSALSGSYEALFNKNAQKLRLLEINSKPKSEEDYKKLLLEHYTYLKRPVAVINDSIFIGNSSLTVAELYQKTIALNKCH
ncbi:MAG: ArsC/Spx/MgsR family protein [Saprospiraceae bacterium]